MEGRMRTAPGGAVAKIFPTRVVSDAGRCPFTAMSFRFQVSDPKATP